MTRNEEIMIEALRQINSKSEMWKRAAESTDSAKAIPPWWILGDIAAEAIIKVSSCRCSRDFPSFLDITGILICAHCLKPRDPE